MNSVIYRLSLDVNKNGVQRTIQGVENKDRYARKFLITLRNGKEPYILPEGGVAAYIYPVLPNGTALTARPCTIEDDQISYTIQPGELAYAGLVRYQLKIIGTLMTGASAVLVSPRFEMEVWESDTDSSPTTSKPDFDTLDELQAEIRAYWNTDRIVDVDIDNNYLITVRFADPNKKYTSTALQTISDRMTGMESDITDIKGDMVSRHNTTLTGTTQAENVNVSGSLKLNNRDVTNMFVKKENLINQNYSKKN